MRHIRSFRPLLCLALLYWGCQKSDRANHASTPTAIKPTTTTINVPEHVAVNTVVSDNPITSISSLANLLKTTASKETDGIKTTTFGISASYNGYTKTYDCSSNTWTYVFAWEVLFPNTFGAPSGTGSLTVGTYSTSGSLVIVGTATVTLPTGATDTKYYIHVALTTLNDNNYCSSDSLYEMLSFSYTVPAFPGGRGGGPVTEHGAGSNTEGIVPNVYQTYNDIVAGFSSNGNGTFTLDVTPGVTTCGTACNAAIGFPPTVTFYYSLEGSGTWQSYSQAGTDLNEFFITLPQAGTYDYYTQEDTAPGVLSGELGSGSITVQ